MNSSFVKEVHTRTSEHTHLSPQRPRLATERLSLLHRLRGHASMPAVDPLIPRSCRASLSFSVHPEVEPAGDRPEPARLVGLVEHAAQDHPIVGADGGGAVGAAGGVLMEGAGPPDVRATAMDLGVTDGRGMVDIPDPPRGLLDEASQGPGDTVGVPGAVLDERFQGLPGGAAFNTARPLSYWGVVARNDCLSEGKRAARNCQLSQNRKRSADGQADNAPHA